MVMMGAVGETLKYSTADVTTVPDNPSNELNINGAKKICVTVCGTASADCDITLSLGLAGTVGYYPDKAGVAQSNLTVALTGTGTSTFVLNNIGTVEGYSMLRINSIAVSAGAVTSAIVAIESIF
ncbi:MAG: hypothetical protein WC936_06495 [Candidatus Nanoarchaeia archaeon]|jgi:hypothetical protein